MTDAIGASTYSFDDNGNRQSLSETYVSSQPSDYKETISETALYYLRVRYYNLSIGRFISVDSYWG